MPKVRLPREWKFGSIPEEIFKSDLSIYAKILVGAINFHAFDDGPSWPGQSRLSKMCSCSIPSIHRATEELEKSGFLVVERNGGKSSTYQFLSKTPIPQIVVEPIPLSPRQDTPIPQIDPPLSPRQTNETNTTRHENETNIATTPQGAFVDWFKIEYQKEWGNPYVDSKADYIQIVRVLKAYKTIEALKPLVIAGWRTPDEKSGFSISQVCRTVTGFCAVINRIKPPKRKLTPREEAELKLKQKEGL